jgi:hypothetical protein
VNTLSEADMNQSLKGMGVGVALVIAVLAPIWVASADKGSAMKIRITVNDKAITASLIDGETTRDFVSLLPLTLTMNDLFNREKFGHLPRALAEGGKRTKSYEVGDVIYWPPGPDVAVFYRHDGQSIPTPGIIILGKVEVGVEALEAPGLATATIELLGEQR